MLQRNFPTRTLVSRLGNYYTRTVSTVLRLPFYVRGIDVFYVGWMGQQLVPLIRLFSKKPIIFDTAPSLYDSFIDRGYAREGSLKARFLFWLDRYAYCKAQIIIIGDLATIEYFSQLFAIPQEKFRMFPVCANNEIFYSRPVENNQSEKSFVVEFVGEMAPQHGVPHIVKVAKILEESGITFRIAGVGQSLPEAQRVYQDLTPSNVIFLPYRIPLAQLLEWRGGADVCLGLFGDTPKTRRSLSNKLFEALAMGKAFLTAGPPEAFGVGLHFSDGKELFFARIADPQSIADKILWLRDHPEECARVAQEGHEAYKAMCSEEEIEERIVKLVNEVIFTT